MPVFLEIKPLQEGGYHIEGEALEERFEANVKTLPVRVKTLSGWVSLRPNPDPTCVFDDRSLKVYIYRPTLMAEAFLEGGTAERTAARYRRKTAHLRVKLALKMGKRWFMYTPLVRSWIMRTGIGSIDVWPSGTEAGQ